MPRSKVIPLLTRQAQLKRKIRRHLKSQGFQKADDGSLLPPSTEKEAIRSLHAVHRKNKLKAHSELIKTSAPDLLKYFAAGSDISPTKISPVLQKISADTWESDLFRLAGLTWSVPVSNGFGRRMRYLVWDQYHGKLMGIAALGDPVFNLRVRDELIGWNTTDRVSRLVNILDAYVLGAVPPYNQLLGGKLVACLMRSSDVYNDFKREYGNSTGIISGEKKGARLLAITTSSSMGRSSVYNRLKLASVPYFQSIGYSSGWGHFHIPDDLFKDMRDYLRAQDKSYADEHGFGQGPNWKLRTSRQALSSLGMNVDIMKHGIRREVFWCPLAENAISILKEGRGKPKTPNLLSVTEIGALARDRWMVPRASSRPDFQSWTLEQLAASLSIPARQQKKVLTRRIAE